MRAYLEAVQLLYQQIFASSTVILLFLLLIVVVLAFLWFITFEARNRLLKLLAFILCHGLALIASYKIGNLAIVYPFLMLLPSLILGLIAWGLYHTIDREDEMTFRIETNKGSKFFSLSKHMGVFGSTGAGKTESGFVPVIKHIMKWGLASLIFDYKDFELMEKVYGLKKVVEQENKIRAEKGKKVYPLPPIKTIYFFDPNLSDHFNPIAPRYMERMEDVDAMSIDFFDNLYPGDGNNGSFFKDSGAAAFAGLTWLYKEDYPDFCNFPCVCTTLILASGKQLMEMISKNDKAMILAAPFMDSKGNDKQLASVKSSMTAAIKKVCTPTMFMVMKQDDINLDINDPDNPTILGIVNVPTYDQVYLPVIALVSRMVMNRVTKRKRRPMIFLLDEGSALFFRKLDRVLATLRSYKVLVVWGLQDKIQGTILYTENVLRSIFSNLNILFLGKANDVETSEYYSKMFEPKEVKERSYNTGDGSQRVTVSTREKAKYKPIEFRKRNTGQFFILDSNANDHNVKIKMTKYENTPPTQKHFYTEAEIEDNFKKVFTEMKQFIKSQSEGQQLDQTRVDQDDDPFKLREDH